MKSLIKLSVVSGFFYVLLSPMAVADILSVHCPNGCPSNPDDNDLVFAHVYALSNNPDTKFADWVAYEVSPTNFGTTPGRVWKSDPLLDSEDTLEKADYKSANSSLHADRGHQAPLASFAGSKYWSELNRLSNITPQNKELNQGPWKNLEDAVRTAATYRKSLFVITGPLFNQTMPSLPASDEPHKVPAGYFKVIYDSAGNSSSFIMQQSTKRKDDYCSKRANPEQMQSLINFTLPVFKDNDVIYKRLGCVS
ncbi:MAG: endonuclease G [Oceanospirillaceae bacterium]|jgi:endonuclease G